MNKCIMRHPRKMQTQQASMIKKKKLTFSKRVTAVKQILLSSPTCFTRTQLEYIRLFTGVAALEFFTCEIRRRARTRQCLTHWPLRRHVVTFHRRRRRVSTLSYALRAINVQTNAQFAVGRMRGERTRALTSHLCVAYS